MGSRKIEGVRFSYVYFHDGFKPTERNFNEIRSYIVSQADLTINGRELGFGWASKRGREEITPEQYRQLMIKCERNVPKNYRTSKRLLYLLIASGPNMGSVNEMCELTRDKLNKCLRSGGIKYTPAVYIVVEPKKAAEPTEVVDSTDTRSHKKPKQERVGALYRMDVLLDRLLETL